MNSPFTNMINTGSVPSDTECQIIYDFLVGPRQEIADLTNKIDELTKRRATLDEFVTAHLALVSPIRRLPDDILREIFVACLPSGENSVMVEYDAPLLLCHVSRAWRHLALNTPRLWVSLHICLPPSDRVSFMNNWAKEWLSRSGILPLSISFFADRPFSETFDQDLGTVFGTLISFSLRWEHIRFNMPTYTTFSPLASLSPADVPSLRTATVAIKGFGRTSNDHPLDPVADWDNLSFLGSTGVHGACISANSTNLSLLPLRWERLRRLSFRGTFAVNAPVALAILKQCPLLEMCSLMVLLGDLPPLSPCRLEHLRDLYVMDRGGGFGSMQLFANLVAPKLAYLQLYIRDLQS